MRVAIDVHDVLADYVGALALLYGPAPNGYTQEHLRRMWPRVNWAAHFNPDHHNSFLASLKPIQGAAGGVRALNSRFECFYLSANTLDGHLVTSRWLRLNKFPSLELVLVGGQDEKEKVIRELPQDTVIVDDMPRHLRAAREMGKTAIAFARPWNEIVSQEDMLRCKDWKELCDVLLNPDPN